MIGRSYKPGDKVVCNQALPVNDGQAFWDGLRPGKIYTVRKYDPLWAPPGMETQHIRHRVVWLEEIRRPPHKAWGEDPPFGAQRFNPVKWASLDEREIQVDFDVDD